MKKSIGKRSHLSSPGPPLTLSQTCLFLLRDKSGSANGTSPCSLCTSLSPNAHYSLSWQTTMWYWECAVKWGSWGAPCVELQGVTPIQLLDAILPCRPCPCLSSTPLTHGFITTVNNGCSHTNTTTTTKHKEDKRQKKQHYFFVLLGFPKPTWVQACWQRGCT